MEADFRKDPTCSGPAPQQFDVQCDWLVVAFACHDRYEDSREIDGTNSYCTICLSKMPIITKLRRSIPSQLKPYFPAQCKYNTSRLTHEAFDKNQDTPRYPCLYLDACEASVPSHALTRGIYSSSSPIRPRIIIHIPTSYPSCCPTCILCGMKQTCRVIKVECFIVKRFMTVVPCVSRPGIKERKPSLDKYRVVM